MDTDSTRDTSNCCEDYRRGLYAWQQSRRNFLSTTIGALAVAPMVPGFMMKSSAAEKVVNLDQSQLSAPILVVLQLGGGNDGLNTVVPYGSSLYYQDRPTLAVAQKDVLPINNDMGLNPNLKDIKSLYDKGKVAIVQGVGYRNPNRSHFTSTAIWETGVPDHAEKTGWLGRYLDSQLANVDNPLKALAIGPFVQGTLASATTPVASIQSVDTFKFLAASNPSDHDAVLGTFKAFYGGATKDLPPYLGLVKRVEASTTSSVDEIAHVGSTFKPAVKYPATAFGKQLELVSQLISANLGTRVFHLTLGSFDDHANEKYAHARLLMELNDGVAALYADLDAHGKTDQVLIYTWSEFGRRVRENASGGTDHGTAAPLFVIGGKVKGGIYGDDPILSNLDTDGDLVYGIDYRSVYATFLQNWLGADPKPVLGGTYETVPFV